MTTTTTLQPPEASAVDRSILSTGSHSATYAEAWTGEHYGSRYRHIQVWDLGTIPADAVIQSATLTMLNVSDSIGSDTEVCVYRVDDVRPTESVSWLTYNGSDSWTSDGGDYTTTFASIADQAPGADLVRDVTDMLVDAIDNRGGFLSILIATTPEIDETASGSERIKYHSSNATSSSDRPKIDIVYERVNRWTGTSADGDLDTVGNWSAGVVPTAGARAVFADGADAITSGSLTCGVVCFAEGFRGSFGESRTHLSVDADTVTLSATGASLFLSLDNADCNVFVAAAPHSVSACELSGDADRVFVSRASRTVTINVDANELVIGDGSPLACKVSTGIDFSGAIVCNGAGASVDSMMTAAGDIQIGTSGKATTSTTSTDIGVVTIGGRGTLDFRADGIGAGSSIMRATFDATENDNAAAEIGGDLTALYGASVMLDSAAGRVNFETDALTFVGGAFDVGAGVTVAIEGVTTV